METVEQVILTLNSKSVNDTFNRNFIKHNSYWNSVSLWFFEINQGLIWSKINLNTCIDSNPI